MKSVSRAVFGVFCACAFAFSAFAAEPEYVLKAGSVLAPDHPYSLSLIHLAELLNKKTNGRIKMDVFPSGQLGGETEMIQALQLGTLDFEVCATAPLSNFTKALFVLDLPYLFRDTQHVYAVEDGEIGKRLLKQVTDEVEGVRAMNFMECGFMELANTKLNIQKPEDMKGLNVRVMENAIYLAYFSALGANPIAMALTEVYPSLQNGTIDAVTNPVVTIYTSGFHNVAKYVSLTDNIYIPAILLMSADLYDRLPDDLKKIVTESCNEAMVYERNLFVDLYRKCYDSILQDGAQINTVDPSPWRDQAFLDSIYSKFVPSLIPADLVEAIKAVK